MLNLGMNLQRLAAKQVEFTPASLFNKGEAGVWYDPSAASGSLDWRKNLLEYTESFDNTIGWAKGTNTVITPNASTYNGSSASRVQMPASAGTFVMAPVQLIKGVKYTFSIYLKNNGSPDLNIGVGTTVSSGVGEGVNYTVTNEWVRYVYVYTAATSSEYWVGIDNRSNSTAVDVYAWGAQVEEASTASSYQPILSTFDSAFKAAFPSHTLYQDYQGVTPVTAVGQPVGLMLDKSEGLAQGPELITNGDFSNGTTDWISSNATLAVIDNALQITSTGGNRPKAYQSISTVVGRFYTISATARIGSSNLDAEIEISGIGAPASGRTNSSIDTRVFAIFQATAAAHILQVKIDDATVPVGDIVYFDNISVTEIQGSHATQPTSTKRPIYARHPEGGIRNLLNYTEQFDNGAWAKTGVTVTPNTTIAPDGTQTADTAVFANTYGSSIIRDYVATLASTYTFSFYAKASSAIQIGARVGSANTSFTLSTEWQRFTLSASVTADANTIVEIRGGVVSGVTAQIWGAQLEEATEASNYQKVVTDIDVTESGVGEVYYLKFDGVDDGMSINNLTSPNTPLTALFGYSATNANAVNGKFLVDILTGRTVFGASTYAVSQIGYFDGAWEDFNADSDAIKVLTYDLVENDAKIRIDGTQEHSDTTYDQKAIGGLIGLFERYDSSGNYLAGNMYQTILRAAESTDEEIAKAETYVANKTGLKAQVDGIATLDLNFGNNTYTAKNSNGGVI